MPIMTDNSNNNNKLRKVDIVIIDDEKFFVEALSAYLQMKKESLVIDKYYHPREFLKNVPMYHKNTKISIDYDFKSDINGIDLAEQLYEASYINLFLVSGKLSIIGKIPSYLTVLSKGDIESFNKLVT
jgi:FixJ family two-component response regulator